MEELNHTPKRLLTVDTILLGIILMAGAVLRFYDYGSLPYSFDEFSALFRTRFDNFSDLIRYGVVTTDTHPAGVQVFMYYWVKLFGEREMVVKLPFILFGLGAIILGYKVGKLWFNGTVGLMVALFLSVLQYPVTYSQFARPYASGIFLSLLMVWFWTLVVFYPERKKALNRFGFIMAAALCAYNHHFSMFLAVLVGISGLFFLKKKDLMLYLILCTGVIVLYLPHIQILFAQINKGGVEEWLNKPGPGFILEYLGYILHFDKYLMILTAAVFIASLFLYNQRLRESNKFRLLAFLWFTITFLTGYFYSVYVNALLQYSVLIFVFPFLVIFVFSVFRDVRGWIKVLIVLLFGSVAIYTLIYERKHYEMMYESAYEQIPLTANDIVKSNPEKKVASVIFEPEKIREYSIKKFGIDDRQFFYPDTTTSFIEFRNFIQQQEADLVVLGWVNNPVYEYKLIVEEKYPYVLLKKDWFKGQLFLYAKNKPEDPNYISSDPALFSSINTFDSFTPDWAAVPLYYQLEKGVAYPADRILTLNKGFGFSPEFNAKLDEITTSQMNEILISVDTYMPTIIANPAIICEFSVKGKMVSWRAANVIEFIDAPMKRLKAHLVVKLADKHLTNPETKVEVYFWNRNLEYIYIDNFRVEVREGNPVIYGLFNKI